MARLTECSTVLVSMANPRKAQSEPKADRPKTPLAKNIARYRHLADLTQPELAERAGLSSVAMIESGKRGRGTREETIKAIAAALTKRFIELDLPYRVTPDDLRASTSSDVVAATKTLDAFLKSPAADGITPEEEAELRRAVWPWGVPTVRAWYFALEALRASQRQ